jgi:hypothetical protein
LPVFPSGTQRVSSPRGLRRALVGGLLATVLLVPSPAAGAIGSGNTLPATITAATLYPWAPWLTEEAFYLGLINCTRTGGWVQKDGSCIGYGSGKYSAYVAPLKRYWGISDKVSRPYAKLLAVNAKCSHFLDGDPGYRLRRAGYYSYAWGENIGCRDGYTTAKAAILASHLVFQSEKSTNGGHWKNLKNSRYTYVGIGVWRYGSRTRLVTDFYRP